MRILIIDDDDDLRCILDLVLAAQGHEVVTAADGVVGLDQLRVGVRPSLILLDMMMPRLDGEGFLRAMRSNPHTADIPVVILTGHPDAHEKAAQLGTAGCLVKPVELAELLGTIARLNNTRVLPR
jgi:CheY-like chemotaxis protein